MSLETLDKAVEELGLALDRHIQRIKEQDRKIKEIDAKIKWNRVEIKETLKSMKEFEQHRISQHPYREHNYTGD